MEAKRKYVCRDLLEELQKLPKDKLDYQVCSNTEYFCYIDTSGKNSPIELDDENKLFDIGGTA